MKFLAAALLVFLSTSTLAADWTCRNKDMEISCTEEKCASAHSFTPMQIHIGHSGAFNVCAYSGCWSGKGVLSHSGTFVTVTARNLMSSRTGARQEPRSIAVAIDSQDGVGVMKMGGYAQPLACARMK